MRGGNVLVKAGKLGDRKNRLFEPADDPTARAWLGRSCKSSSRQIVENPTSAMTT
jgi:hypothetical protein